MKRSTPQENVEYVLDDKFVLQEAAGTTGHPSYRRYHYANQQLAVVDGAGTRFFGNDSLGSASDLTTTDGTVSRATKYDAWGKPIAGAPSANDPKLGYTGHQFDPETGLTYARARYYDPSLGIFLSMDPREPVVGDAPWLDRYVYVKDNPLIFTDPDGLMSNAQIDQLRQAEADKEAEVEQYSKQYGSNSPLARRAKAELSDLRNAEEYMSSAKDFEDNVETPVVVEADQMILAAPAAEAAATVQAGRVLLTAAGAVGVAQGGNEAIEGAREGNGWKVLHGASTVVASGAAMGSGAKEVEEGKNGLLKWAEDVYSKAGQVIRDGMGGRPFAGATNGPGVEVPGPATASPTPDGATANTNSLMTAKGEGGGRGGSSEANEPSGSPKRDDPVTSRAARRKAMDMQGIPKSQQPTSQGRDESGHYYEYEVPKPGGGTETKSVQQQTLDRSHPGQGHWEAGGIKRNPETGEPVMNRYGRPRLKNSKSKVNYDGD